MNKPFEILKFAIPLFIKDHKAAVPKNFRKKARAYREIFSEILLKQKIRVSLCVCLFEQ